MRRTFVKCLSRQSVKDEDLVLFLTDFLCRVVMLREEEWQVLKSAYNPNMEVKIWKSCDLSCDLSPKHVVDKWLSSPG